MKLKKLLSFVLLVSTIFLAVDAKAAGHGPDLIPLADSISQTVMPGLNAALGQPELQQMAIDVNEKLDQFRNAYNSELRVIAKRRGLGGLALRVGNLAARTSDHAPEDFKDIIKNLIAFLQTNFVDRGIKIDVPGSISLRDAIGRCAATLQPGLQDLVAANDLLH